MIPQMILTEDEDADEQEDGEDSQKVDSGRYWFEWYWLSQEAKVWFYNKHNCISICSLNFDITQSVDSSETSESADKGKQKMVEDKSNWFLWRTWW